MQPWATAFLSGASLLTNKPTWPYLSYVVSTHLSQPLICHPWWCYTHLCWLTDMYLAPGLGTTCSMALVAQLPPGMRKLKTAAQRLQGFLEPRLKDMPGQRQQCGRCHTRLKMKMLLTWQVQQKAEEARSELLVWCGWDFCLSQRQHVKNPPIFQLLLGKGICQREKKLTLKKVH